MSTDLAPKHAGSPASDISPARPVLALGGGPAGLTAGYLLAKQGHPVIVLESTDNVGGIARTEVRDGYRFDLGGHRFFTKSREVDELWHEVRGMSSSGARASRGSTGTTSSWSTPSRAWTWCASWARST